MIDQWVVDHKFVKLCLWCIQECNNSMLLREERGANLNSKQHLATIAEIQSDSFSFWKPAYRLNMSFFFLLQAIGCYCYWDMHSIKLTEHVHAGRHNRVCTECSVAWVAFSSPGIGERAGVGRGWRIDGDGWLAWEGGRIRGSVVGQISSLQLWRRN